MDNVADTVGSIRSKGIDLWIHGGVLRYRTPLQGLSPEETELLTIGSREILSALLGSNTDIATAQGTTTPALARHVPLTFQQETALKYTNRPYVGINAIRLNGYLNITALSGSLQILVRRHGALRTRIAVVGTALRQIVDSGDKWRLNVKALNVKALNGEARHRTDTSVGDIVERSIQDWLGRGGPAFEAHLLRVGEREHVLLILRDRMTQDHSSFNTLFKELWVLYADFLEGKCSNLLQEPFQYADYAIWQRDVYYQSQGKCDVFWRKALSDGIPAVLPADQATPVDSPASGVFEGSWSESLSSHLRALSRREQVTLSRAVLAVFVIVVAHVTGQQKFAVLTSCSGRNYPEHLDVMGLFAHYAPIIGLVSGSERFSDLLRNISQQLDNVYDNLDVGKNSDEGITQFFESLLFQWFQFKPTDNYMQVPKEWDVRTNGLKLDRVPLDLLLERCLTPVQQPIGDFRNIFCFYDTSKGIESFIVYRADKYTERAIKYFVDEMRLVTELVVDKPWARIGSFPFWNLDRKEC